MNALDTAQCFIEHCRRTQRMEELMRAFQSSLEQLGFRYFACGSHVDPLNPHHAVMVFNYPRCWIEAYSERQLHCIDPVLLRADRAIQPFRWDDADFLAGMSDTQRDILTEARRFGVENGYTIPIHSPPASGLARGSCSLVPDSPMLHGHCYFAAQLMAGYLFESAARLLGARSDRSTRPQLPLRERQCLSLVACGKTDWEIAKLLVIGECTVHNYVESAKRRLSVGTRMQAVLQAIATEQITIGEAIRPHRPLSDSGSGGAAVDPA